MDRSAARLAYTRQKNGAKARGIGWEFNFDSWLAWWGDDIVRRGTSPNSLQMQRFADTGPYAVCNVRKGTPKENSKTRGHMDRKRNGEAAKAALEAARDACEPTVREKHDFTEDEQELHKMFAPRSSRCMYGSFKR